MVPLKNSISNNSKQSSNSLIGITDTTYKIIFGEIEVLLFYNTVFKDNLLKLSKSSSRNKELNVNLTIGQAFLVIADFAQLYIKYIKNFNNAILMLNKTAQGNKQFAFFLTESNSKSKFGTLEELLWLPIYRVNHYVLFVEEIINNSWNDNDIRKLQLTKEKWMSVLSVRFDTFPKLAGFFIHILINSKLFIDVSSHSEVIAESLRKHRYNSNQHLMIVDDIFKRFSSPNQNKTDKVSNNTNSNHTTDNTTDNSYNTFTNSTENILIPFQKVSFIEINIELL
jgi:hypothetical protein